MDGGILIKVCKMKKLYKTSSSNWKTTFYKQENPVCMSLYLFAFRKMLKQSVEHRHLKNIEMCFKERGKHKI